MKEIAIYSGPGTENFVKPLEKALKILGLFCKRLDKNDIKEKLNKFEILIIPGGWTEKYVRDLRDSYEKIKNFISRGEKYIGICAGAYLTPKECIIIKKGKEIKLEGLGIIEAKCERQSPKMMPGRLRKIKLKRHFLTRNCPQEINIWYQNGPRISSDNRGVRIIANYENGSGAIAFSRYGKGGVIIFSPHPEGDPEGKINPQKLRTLNLLKNAIIF